MRPASPLLLLGLPLWIACGDDAASTVDAAPAGAADARVACSSVDARTSCDGVTGCDFFLQCGCGATDKCTVATTGVACAPAGQSPAGAACSTDAECARGTICVPFFGTLQCMQFCDSAHACPTDMACYVNVKDIQDRPAGELCAPSCSLVAQDCPATGTATATGCYVSEKHCTIDEGICLASGGASQGTPCTKMGDCQKGHLCIDPAGPSTPMCAKICDRMDGVPSCDVGTCRELPGHTQTGICLP
jgi:hypothetical protein